jgi:hypothetical protein
MTGLLAFALVIIALSTFFTWMQRGEEEKFLRDFGIGFILLITLLMSIFLASRSCRRKWSGAPSSRFCPSLSRGWSFSSASFWGCRSRFLSTCC